MGSFDRQPGARRIPVEALRYQPERLWLPRRPSSGPCDPCQRAEAPMSYTCRALQLEPQGWASCKDPGAGGIGLARQAHILSGDQGSARVHAPAARLGLWPASHMVARPLATRSCQAAAPSAMPVLDARPSSAAHRKTAVLGASGTTQQCLEPITAPSLPPCGERQPFRPYRRRRRRSLRRGSRLGRRLHPGQGLQGIKRSVRPARQLLELRGGLDGFHECLR